jgi:hypothetical protein
MADDEKSPRRDRPGRPPLPEEEKKHYKQPGLSLRPDQIDHLQELAEVLSITSRSGVNFGKASWRTLIAIIADSAEPVIEAIRQQKDDTERTFYPIHITPEITLIIGPPPDPELEAAKEEIRQNFQEHRVIEIVRDGDLPVAQEPPPPEA